MDDSVDTGNASAERFIASLEPLQDEATVKTYADAQYQVLWHADDRLSVFDHATANREYRFKGETGDESGTFEVVSATGSSGSALEHCYAVYPYDAWNSVGPTGVLEVELPEFQPYAGPSFAQGINTMVAVSDSEDLQFKNACGYLGVKLYGLDRAVSSICLTGNDGELVSGSAQIIMTVSGLPETSIIDRSDGRQEEVELTCDPAVGLGATAEAYTEFWFVLPPMTFSNGLTITVTGSKGDSFVQSTDKAITIQRSRITRLSPVSAEALSPLPGPEPEPDSKWVRVTGLDLPESVKIYETTAQLYGRANHAWFAIADPKEVDVRVLYPGGSTKKTIDAQASAAGNCLVLVNGGIFGSKPNGFALCDGVQTPWFRVEDDNWDVDRQYWGPDVNGKDVAPAPDNQLHTVSRAMFGVDAEGNPGAYWSYTPSYGKVYVYDKPIPSVEGESVRPGGTMTYPCKPADWVPYNAITCGPMLLKDGECPINDHTTSKGYWETNYEMWADDIFGVNQRADRTAVGYTARGNVILCVVDGRIDSAKGATTLEMAALMKELGCVGAINLDGGGSTGMWAAGQHLNDLTGGNRAVMTTIGFFSKSE